MGLGQPCYQRTWKHGTAVKQNTCDIMRWWHPKSLCYRWWYATTIWDDARVSSGCTTKENDVTNWCYCMMSWCDAMMHVRVWCHQMAWYHPMISGNHISMDLKLESSLTPLCLAMMSFSLGSAWHHLMISHHDVIPYDQTVLWCHDNWAWHHNMTSYLTWCHMLMSPHLRFDNILSSHLMMS